MINRDKNHQLTKTLSVSRKTEKCSRLLDLIPWSAFPGIQQEILLYLRVGQQSLPSL